MKVFKLALMAIILLSACNSNGVSTNNGKKVFTYKPLGWQILLPEGWVALENHELDKLAYKAENYYEEDNRSKNDEKKIIFGIHKIEKDVNALYAFIREIKQGDDPPKLSDLLQQQYHQYSTDMYTATKSLSQETISNKTFDVAVLSVSYNGKPYFDYITYSTMIGNTNFGASIVSNNEADKNMLVSHFRTSVKALN